MPLPSSSQFSCVVSPSCASSSSSSTVFAVSSPHAGNPPVASSHTCHLPSQKRCAKQPRFGASSGGSSTRKSQRARCARGSRTGTRCARAQSVLLVLMLHQVDLSTSLRFKDSSTSASAVAVPPPGTATLVDLADGMQPSFSFLEVASHTDDDRGDVTVAATDEQPAEAAVSLEDVIHEGKDTETLAASSAPTTTLDAMKGRQHPLLHKPGVTGTTAGGPDELALQSEAMDPVALADDGALDIPSEEKTPTPIEEKLGSVVEELPASSLESTNDELQPQQSLEIAEPTGQEQQILEEPGLDVDASTPDGERSMAVGSPRFEKVVGEVLREPEEATSEQPLTGNPLDEHSRSGVPFPELTGPETPSPGGVSHDLLPTNTSVQPTLKTSAEPLRPGEKRKAWKEVLMAIGSGTGFVDEPSWNNLASKLQRDLIDRAWYQSNAVLLLVTILYLGALVEGLIVVYNQVKNDSPVTFYADPRVHSSSMDSYALEDFLASFNTPPKHVFLQVTGYLPVEDGFFGWDSLQNVVEWKGSSYHVAFSFSLDLSTWATRLPSSSPTGGYDQEGFALADLDVVRAFLADESNDLEMLDIRKKVVWPGWEELAQSIKEHIQQQGFGGMVVVKCTDGETMSVFKNRQWANFMHNHATKALAAISLIGLLPYIWYMSRMCRTKTVEVQHQINISTHEFWTFIVEQMSSNGFESIGVAAERHHPNSNSRSRSQRPRQQQPVGGTLPGVDWRS